MGKAIDFVKKLHETGEMSASELEPGGDWHEFRLELEGICKAAGLKCEVKPFDQYQGPYAYVEGPFGGGKLWGLGSEDSPENEFYFEYYDKGQLQEYQGGKEDMTQFLSGLKKKGKKSK